MFTPSAFHTVNCAEPVSSAMVPDMISLSSPLMLTVFFSADMALTSRSTLPSVPFRSAIFILAAGPEGPDWGALVTSISWVSFMMEPLLPMLICILSFQVLVYAFLNLYTEPCSSSQFSPSQTVNCAVPV